MQTDQMNQTTDLSQKQLTWAPRPTNQPFLWSLFDFHSFLSGDLQQTPSMVDNRMMKKKHSIVLKEGERVLGSTDGCPGHGKCEVGTINGVDWKAICREAIETPNNTNLGGTGKSDTSQLQTFTANNVGGKRKFSAALNCKHAVLESKGAEGVKSEGNFAGHWLMSVH